MSTAHTTEAEEICHRPRLSPACIEMNPRWWASCAYNNMPSASLCQPERPVLTCEGKEAFSTEQGSGTSGR